jgi:hypothetical protein
VIALELGLGALLGALAALWHLRVAWWRARRLTRHGATAVLASAPLGLAGPALAVVLAAWIAPAAACAVPVGLLVARWIALRGRR